MALLGLLALPLALAWCLLYWLYLGGEWLVKYLMNRRAAKRAAIEAELNRKQSELRHAVLRLASAMNAEGLEARKALIRQSYLARGEVPKD